MITKASILRAKEALNQVDEHIKGYLKHLQDVEASIILQDKDIASGGCGCHHYRPHKVWFHTKDEYGPYITDKIKYKIIAHEEYGVKVKVDYLELTIPYEFNTVEFDKQCADLFGESIRDMEKCFKQKKRVQAKEKAQAKVDERIGRDHHFNGYTYHWEKCTHKGCSWGKVTVSTGKYTPSVFYNYDPDHLTEEFVGVPCPVCKATQGVVVVIKGSMEKKLPCSKWFFESNEDDLMYLMTECT